MPGRKGMTHYGMELKLQAVQLHEDEGLTYPQIAQQLGMRTVWQIEIWVRRYRQEGVEGLKRKGSGRPRKTDSLQARIAQLEMENALLKKYHTELRKAMLAKRNIGSSSTTEKNTR
jgi:transposase